MNFSRPLYGFGCAGFLFAASGLCISQDGQRREAPPAAIVSGSEPLHWDDLRPALSEAAGATVLAEVALDRVLLREFKARGWILEAGAEAAESTLLAESMARTAGALSPDEQVRMVDSVRKSRGLGPTRYAALLKRNAMLRRMVRDEVVISEADIDQAFALRHGEKFRARIIAVPDEATATAVLRRVRPASGTPEPFGEVAADVSNDASRARGGLIDAFSPADPTYPVSLRQAVAALQVGQVAGPIAVDGGFAIVRLDARLPADSVSRAEVSNSLRREIRVVRERVLMERLAARLLGSQTVSVMDPSLGWSWDARPQPPNP